MLRAWREWRARRAVNSVALGNEFERPWPLKPDARLYMDLDFCFVNVYNRVRVGPDPVGRTSVSIEARPGYVIEPEIVHMNGITRLQTVIRDPRRESEQPSALVVHHGGPLRPDADIP